jgi:hypothetical protein
MTFDEEARKPGDTSPSRFDFGGGRLVFRQRLFDGETPSGF